MAQYLKRQEAAEFLGIAPVTLDRWAREGKVQRYRLPSSQRITRFKIAELEGLFLQLPEENTDCKNGEHATTLEPPVQAGNSDRIYCVNCGIRKVWDGNKYVVVNETDNEWE